MDLCLSTLYTLPEVSGVSVIPASWKFVPVLVHGFAWFRCQEPGATGHDSDDTALGNVSPESTAFSRHAGCHVRSPDGIAALLSIMGHGRHVQTGVPMTHLSPETSPFMVC